MIDNVFEIRDFVDSNDNDYQSKVEKKSKRRSMIIHTMKNFHQQGARFHYLEQLLCRQ